MQTEVLKIDGMTCGGCTGSVTSALKAIRGVGDVKVSLSPGEATVEFDERLASREDLASAVKAAGYGVNALGSPDSPPTNGCCCG